MAQAKKKGAARAVLGITAPKVSPSPTGLAAWYSQVVTKAELIEYYDVSGCYILRPDSFEMWEAIQHWLDTQFRARGVRNAYFPLLIPRRALEREKAHVAGFAPEVAWVTRVGDGSDVAAAAPAAASATPGDAAAAAADPSVLAEPLAIRPTSETAMYAAYAKWIRSYRDLPLKLNQWANVVRWEFKQATPFLRSREFLWQEGHTAFATREAALEEMHDILDVYANAYEQLLACPVVKGRKSELERFPGGDITTTVELFVDANGRAIQGATSHHLGQNFARMNDIKFEATDGSTQFAYQNSWGFTTRAIGVMIMVHGDDKGLVLPPRVAPTQVVVIPISRRDTDNATIAARARGVAESLRAAGIRAHCDDRELFNPGFKFAHWEMKGVPLRLAFGPKDLENGTIELQERPTSCKSVVTLDEGFAAIVLAKLEAIQAEMLAAAKAKRDAAVVRVTEWKAFGPTLDRRCLALAPWCNESACEEDVKRASGEEAAAAAAAATALARESPDDAAAAAASGLTGAAKSLCMPFEGQFRPELPAGTACFRCGMPATVWCLWGRSY